MQHHKQRPDELTIPVALTDEQAYQYAQYLKRVCLSDYERCATSQDEAYLMLTAGARIQKALAQKGFAPR